MQYVWRQPERLLRRRRRPREQQKKKPEAKKPSRRQGFQTHLTGRGDYYSTAGMDYPGVGGELGKSFATAIGGPSFAELGKFLGHGAHKY